MYVTLHELGKVAESQENWDLPASSFKSAMEVNPDNSYGWMRLGLAHINGFNDTYEVKSSLRKSLAYGNIDWAHFDLGRTLDAQGREVEAMGEMPVAFRITHSWNFRDEILALLSRTNGRQAAPSAHLLPAQPSRS